MHEWSQQESFRSRIVYVLTPSIIVAWIIRLPSSVAVRYEPSMLTGEKVGLRARHQEDIPILRDGLFDDVVHTARAAGTAWRPFMPGPEDPRFVIDEKDRTTLHFSVVELEGGTLVGSAVLWGFEAYHRSAHVGLGLLESSRGQGYGSDAVAVLCHYAFVVQGLHRVQIETLADNVGMLRAAENNGFVREGMLRSAAWVMGEFMDQVVLGLLAEDWKR
jgi:RimJ/RimL family protein N-acetyltransferase